MSKIARLEDGEDAARGREARGSTPRSAHAEWEPAAGREDPIAILRRRAEARVAESPSTRYGRMAASAFDFYRGAAAVMAADLAATPSTGLAVQLCGDAHIANFGGFAAPDGRFVFGPDDFDETLPGPWEWDVKRFAASIEIAARQLGLGRKRRRRIVAAAVGQYRGGMAESAAGTMLEAWYERLDADEVTARFGTRVDADGPELFAGDPLDGADAWVRGLLDEYAAGLSVEREHIFRSYRFAEAARTVDDLGTPAWLFRLVSAAPGEPLVLRAREAVASVLEPHLGASEFANHGERVVRGQRMMQAATDLFLGWRRSLGRDGLEHDFYLRQLWRRRASADLTRMDEHELITYGLTCAWSLARSHARSGDRLAIAGYLGKGERFDAAIAEFASRYADQNERDHARLAEAIAAGEVEAAD